eukprot:9449611-Pyramimonas_sp.AAC.1
MGSICSLDLGWCLDLVLGLRCRAGLPSEARAVTGAQHPSAAFTKPGTPLMNQQGRRKTPMWPR